jgi:DNA-binding MarR family transcriptional regulator
MQQNNTARGFADEMRRACLGTRVGRLHRAVARRFDGALRPLGLTMPQAEILASLVLHDAPVRPSELAQVLMAERSTISRNLAAMRDRGWVETAEVSPTGRSMAFAATPDGARVLASAREAWAEAQASVAGPLGPGAPATLDAWLDGLG